jgi:hypothetical protein
MPKQKPLSRKQRILAASISSTSRGLGYRPNHTSTLNAVSRGDTGTMKEVMPKWAKPSPVVPLKERIKISQGDGKKARYEKTIGSNRGYPAYNKRIKSEVKEYRESTVPFPANKQDIVNRVIKSL